MKRYILLVAAATALAACNNEENYIDEPVAAHISATIGGSGLSRASNSKWDEGDNIGISTDNGYLNLKYTYTTENGKGAFSGTTIYFKNQQEQLAFTAYYPFTGSEGESPAVIEASTGVECQTSAEQSKIDFLYAVKENVTGANPNVSLAFSHQMSKLTFKFVNGNDDTDVSKITSYEIDGLVLEGEFNPVTGACASKSGVPSGVLTLTATVVNDVELPPIILFPQTVDKVTMKFTDSENRKYSCDLNFNNNCLESGNNYQFTIKVKKTKLSVEGGITNWETESSNGKAESAD